MKKEHSSRWRKLDNAAQAFPAATGKKDTRVFRFYCQLKEDIQADLLQKALEETMEHYPVFSMVLRKGLFWFYLEQRDLPAKVEEEKRPPCSEIYVPDHKTLLFQVSYYKTRINFEPPGIPDQRRISGAGEDGNYRDSAFCGSSS